MLAKTIAVALVGTDARVVDIETHVGPGVPSFTLVGLPAASVREAEQRTRAALTSSGERWPPARIVANLAPGALRKEGTHFDLAIALGIVAADERLDPATLEGWMFHGELNLSGGLRSTRAALAAAIACRQARLKGVICPASNAAEAACVDGIEIVPVATLAECLGFLRRTWNPGPILANEAPSDAPVDDMAEVRGQADAKTALEIAAAGGHNVLLSGTPGSGKTMLARRLPTILPAMSRDESLEVTRIYSVAGLLPEGAGLVTQRPFRGPHHHISLAGLIGGGSVLARPGEITLAHASMTICY